MSKTPLKRTTLLLMSLFAGLTLAACHPYQVGYNGQLGAGSFNMNAGDSSVGAGSGSESVTPGAGTGDTSGSGSGTESGSGEGSGASTNPAGLPTTNSVNVVEQPVFNTPPMTCDGKPTCSEAPYKYVINGTSTSDVLAVFEKDLLAANTAVEQAYASSSNEEDDNASGARDADDNNATPSNTVDNQEGDSDDNQEGDSDDSQSDEPQSFYFGVTSLINGHGKALNFDGSKANYYSPTDVNQDPQNPISANLVIGGDVVNATSLTIGENINAQILGGTISPNTTIDKGAILYGVAVFAGNLTNNGRLGAFPKLQNKAYDVTQDPLPIDTPPQFVDPGDGKLLSVGNISFTVDGNFTQTSTGAFIYQGGLMRVNGSAKFDGNVYFNFLPNNFEIRQLLLVSPNKITVDNSAHSTPYVDPEGSHPIFANTYNLQSFLKPEVVQFSLGTGSDKAIFHGLIAYLGGAPADKITEAGFKATYTKHLSPAPCTYACAKGDDSTEPTKTNDSVTTDDTLITALPKEADGTIQGGVYEGLAAPSIIFTQTISGSSDVNFATVNDGQATIVFNKNVALGTLTLNPNTKVILNAATLKGNLTLKNNDDPNSKMRPGELIALGTITGSVNNQDGRINVVQNSPSLLYMNYTFSATSPDVYMLHGVAEKVSTEPLPILSFPVGLIIDGNYTQSIKGKFSHSNLQLASGILFVKGEAKIDSGLITYKYTPTDIKATNLLVLSNHPITVGKDAVFGHIAKKHLLQDSPPVTVKFANNLYGLVNFFAPSPSSGNDDSGDARSVQGVSHKADGSALRAALANVKAQDVNVQVVDTQGRSTGRSIRVAGSNSLVQLRDAVAAGKVNGLDMDLLNGNPLVRMQQANAATRLFLNNNNLFGLLDGVSTKPAKGSKLSVQVGLDNDVLFGGKQRLANASVLHLAVASGPVLGRVALNYVGLRQNTTNRDNVKSGELSHSSGYGLNLGAQVQLPQAGGFAVGANVGFEAFTNKLNLMTGVEPKYNTSVLSATLLGSKDLVLGNLQAKNNLLTVTPFVGYRFARQHNEQFSVSTTVNGNKYDVSVAEQSLMSNSLVAGASVKYQNAFGVQGLQLGAQLAADMALNHKATYKLNLVGPDKVTKGYTPDAKGNNAFTAQGLLSVGYQLNNLQFGARLQLQVNDVVEGSVGGFMNVSF